MHLRAAVSLTAATSFLVLLVSGVAVYLKPLGKTAAWIGWTWLWLDKDQWEAIHTLLSLLFLASIVLHVLLNLRPLLAYVRSRAGRVPERKWELAVALVGPLLFAFGAAWPFPPFSWVMDLNRTLKTQAEVSHPLPFSQADKASIEEACHKAGLAPEVGLRNLEARGIHTRGRTETLEDLAERSRLSPEQVHRSMVLAP